jgi:hypothetical protein
MVAWRNGQTIINGGSIIEHIGENLVDFEL